MYLATLHFSLAILLLSIFLYPASARKWRPWDACPETIKTVISGDPCERGSLRCTWGPQFVSMNNLHRALLHCPNTVSLDLRVTGLGCADWPFRYNFPFNPAGGDIYPTLRSLRLEGYDWDRPRWKEIQPPKEDDVVWPWWGEYRMEQFMWAVGGKMVTWLRWLALPAKQKYKSNLDLWLDAMDWSRIGHLWISGRNYSSEMIEKLPPKLTSLTSLETLSLPFIEALPNNTLTNLTWIGPSTLTDLFFVLLRQGKSLQRLEFRCDELDCDRYTNLKGFQMLPNITQHLTHLSVNMPRNGTWFLEMFDTIAAIPTLCTADLYFNIQSECRRQMPSSWSDEFRKLKREFGEEYCQGQDSFQKPFVNQTSATELFNYMRKKNVDGNLQNVTFWVGDWKRAYDGPIWFPPWANGRRAKVVCTALGSEKVGGDACVVVEGDRYWEKQTRYW